MHDFEAKLEQYADVIVRVGLNLQPGQRLIISAPIEAADFARLAVKKAYQAGASLVTVMWDDEHLTPIRLENAPEDSFEEYDIWLADAYTEHAKGENAFLSIYARNPDLLAGQNQDNIATMQRTHAKHRADFNKLVSAFKFNWLIVSVPTESWAAKIFPDLPADQQIDALWEQIFKLTRVDQPDPVAAWEDHMLALQKVAKALNAKQYDSLHYTGPGTDLTVGLPEGHEWIAAQNTTPGGIVFTPNIPTEEVFTSPHKDRADGVVTSTMPLHYGGMLVENLTVTFENGRVTQITATSGEEVIQKMVETDEGAGRLGELALVPHSSPISQSGRLFYNTLYDENASCHIALGRGFKDAIEGASQMSDEAWAAAGGNISNIHTDFMIGSGELNIDGIYKDGTTEPIMRNGEWAF